MRFIALIFLSLLSLSACKPDGGQQHGAGGMPGMGGPAPKVTAVKPETRDIQEWSDFTGRFEAVDKTEIRPRVGGYLRQIHFKDGQMVNKGDLLFTIDPKPYQANLQEASANTKLAQTQLTLAEQQLARAQDLLSTGDVSQTFYDERLQARNAAAEAVRAAKARTENTGLSVGYTQVRAPIAGRISRSLVDAGNLVAGEQTGQPTLLTTIVSVDPVHFYFNVDEITYLKYARSNQNAVKTSVSIALSDDVDYTLNGTIDFIDNSLNGSSATMQARAVVENANGLVVPGMFGRARIASEETHKAILIPPESIATDQTRKLVMTVGADGSVAPKIVETGPLVDGLQVIKSGLDGSETIVIKGLQRSIPGMKVEAEIVPIATLNQPAAPQQAQAQ